MGVFGTEKVSKCMLQSFACAMASVIKDKRLFFVISEPNLGKGTITEIFRMVFASQLNTLNAQDLYAKESDGNVRSGSPKLSRCSPTRESISGRLNYDRDAKCFINQQTGFFNIYITLHTATCTPASRSAKSHALCWSLSRSFVLFTSTAFTCSSEADRHRMRSGAPQLQPL